MKGRRSVSARIATRLLLAGALSCNNSPSDSGDGVTPHIVLGSSSLSFTSSSGGMAPLDQSVQLTNGGQGALAGLAVGAIAYASGNGWLSASLNSATTPATLTVAVAPGSLAAGSYAASIPITSTTAGVDNSPKVLPVTLTVTAPVGPTAFVDLVAGGAHLCGRTAAGETWCWGSNANGVLGDGTGSEGYAPALVAGSFTEVVAGSKHTCGRTIASVTYCWGLNDFDQIGDGTEVPPLSNNQRFTPTRVVGGQTFVQLAAGEWHTCGLTMAGAVYCWGGNTNGELGDGTKSNKRPVPVAVAGAPAFVALSAGNGRTCGRSSANAVYCWGFRPIGDGTLTDRLTPTAVSGGKSFVHVAVGGNGTCGLLADSTAYCWSRNEFGDVGDGTTVARPAPTPVSGGLKFAQIVAGPDYTCGLTGAHIAYCWGANSIGNIGDGTKGGFGNPNAKLVPTLVSGGLRFNKVVITGFRTTCGLTSLGAVYCWGSDGRIFGNANGMTREWLVPTLVFGTPGGGGGIPGISFSTGTVSFAATAGGSPPATQAVQISNAGSGALSGLALGTVSYIGTGGWLAASLSSTSTPSTLTLSVSIAGLPAGSYSATLPVTATEVTSPQNVTVNITVAPAPLLQFIQVIAGYDHACGRTATSETWCWGNNTFGQLGDGTTINRTTPVRVGGGLAFVEITAQGGHTCGRAASSVYCWGLNLTGQLGDGTNINRSTPTRVSSVQEFVQLSSSLSGTCGRTAQGAVWCWGGNAYGQLGDGTTTNRALPTLVVGGQIFADISSSGDGHACGRTAAGAVYCWGTNSSGQLGDGTTVNRFAPGLVASGQVFTGMTTSQLHSCAWTAGGALYCWGRNATGQLGDGTTLNRTSPTLVVTAPPFVEAAAGSQHTCGRTTGGAIHCWGGNASGQLGDATTTNRSTTAMTSGGMIFGALSVGGSASCGRTIAGTVYCWGLNDSGQLGDGTTVNKSVPTRVSGQ